MMTNEEKIRALKFLGYEVAGLDSGWWLIDPQRVGERYDSENDAWAGALKLTWNDLAIQALEKTELWWSVGKMPCSGKRTYRCLLGYKDSAWGHTLEEAAFRAVLEFLDQQEESQ